MTTKLSALTNEHIIPYLNLDYDNDREYTSPAFTRAEESCRVATIGGNSHGSIVCFRAPGKCLK